MEVPPTNAKKRQAISDLPDEPLAKRPKIENPPKPKRSSLDVLLGR
jgi:hypothetical protein